MVLKIVHHRDFNLENRGDLYITILKNIPKFHFKVWYNKLYFLKYRVKTFTISLFNFNKNVLHKLTDKNIYF